MHATVSLKRQVTLPKWMIDELGVDSNSKVAIFLDHNRLVIEPVESSVIDQVAGRLGGLAREKNSKVTWQKVQQKVCRSWVNHVKSKISSSFH